MVTDGDHKLTITMSDEVYLRIRQALQVRLLSGSAYGLVDALAAKVIDAIEHGQTELVLDKVKKEPI